MICQNRVILVGFMQTSSVSNGDSDRFKRRCGNVGLPGDSMQVGLFCLAADMIGFQRLLII